MNLLNIQLRIFQIITIVFLILFSKLYKLYFILLFEKKNFQSLLLNL